MTDLLCFQGHSCSMTSIITRLCFIRYPIQQRYWGCVIIPKDSQARFISAFLDISPDIQVIIESRVALHQRYGPTKRIVWTVVLPGYTISQTIIHDQVRQVVTAWLLSNCEIQLPWIAQTEALALNQLVLGVCHFHQARHDCAVWCIEHEQISYVGCWILWRVWELPLHTVTSKFSSTWVDGESRHCGEGLTVLGRG